MSIYDFVAEEVVNYHHKHAGLTISTWHPLLGISFASWGYVKKLGFFFEWDLFDWVPPSLDKTFIRNDHPSIHFYLGPMCLSLMKHDR